MSTTLAQHDFTFDGAPEAPVSGEATLASRAARDELRRQIGQLEARLGELWASAFPREGIEWRVGAVGGPRVLDIPELERVRDALVVRIREAQHELARRADVEERYRGALERMIADPAEHRWMLVRNEDLGGRECLNWHSRPRWGILGMLFGWWRVKLSSGCPLARGARPARVPAPTLEQEATQAKAPSAAAPRRGGSGCAGAPRGGIGGRQAAGPAGR